MGEIFAAKMSGIASSLAASLAWILAFTVTNQFPGLVKCLGNGTTFIVFGLVCVVATVFVICFVPETKGRSVDEVQQILTGSREVKNANNCNRTTLV